LKTCPVTCMQRYVTARLARGANPWVPLFFTHDGLPLSRAYFIDKLRLTLAAGGYKPNQYNGHSFRIGAATTAAKASIPDHMIQALGRWSSNCYVRYIQVPKTSLAKAQKAMSIANS